MDKQTFNSNLDKGVKATAGVLGEFKKFITRGNVLDMAIGVIIGSGFTSIVNSLVADVFTPILSLVTNRVDLSELRIILTPATETAAENAIRYGAFLQNVLGFLLQALIIFLFVKMVNRFVAKKEEAKKPAEPSEEVKLLREIRDALKK